MPFDVLDTILRLSSSSSSKDIKVVGSLFIPSKQLLARFKFRPWNGVFLSELYLSDVASAMAISLEIVDIYNEYGVEVVVESSIVTDADVARLDSILGAPGSSVDDNYCSKRIKVQR